MSFSLLIDSVLDSKVKVEFVPADVVHENWVKKDKVEIKIKEVCELLRKGEKLGTAAPAPGRFLEKLKKLSEPVLVLTVAGAYSSIYKSAEIAAKLSRKVAKVIDTGLISIGGGVLVEIIEEMRRNGAGFEEVLKTVLDLKDKIKTYLVPESMKFLARSGRVPELVTKLSNLVDRLGILPIIEYYKEKFRVVKLVKGIENAVKELAKLAKGSFAVVGSTYAPELEKELKELVEEKGIEVKVPWEISAALAVHLGPGAVGIAFPEV